MKAIYEFIESTLGRCEESTEVLNIIDDCVDFKDSYVDIERIVHAFICGVYSSHKKQLDLLKKERAKMQIQTLVKLTNTKDRTDLYSLFCQFVSGDYAEQSKGNSSDTAHLEAKVSKAFDSFAQTAFDKGREYERTVNSNT